MAIDQRLCGGAIIIETGCGHRRFDVADRLLALGNAALEIIDARAAGFCRTRDSAGVRVLAFPLFAIRSATLKESRYITIGSATLNGSRYMLG